MSTSNGRHHPPIGSHLGTPQLLAAEALVMLWGFWALFEGLGALSVGLGVLFLTNPGRAAVGIAVLLGTMAIAWGLVFLASGLLLRSAKKIA